LVRQGCGAAPLRRMKNPELVFSQEFETLQLARIIEKKIKSWKRKDFIDKIIRDGFIKIA
jgi:predicted GIY-YIG superfamily endonuclease